MYLQKHLCNPLVSTIRSHSPKCLQRLETEIRKDSHGLVNILVKKHQVSIADIVGESAGRNVRLLMNNNGATRIDSTHFSETIANEVRKDFLKASSLVLTGLKKSSRIMTFSTLDWLCDYTVICCFNH